MIKAIPIDSKGIQTGEAKNFPDIQWEKMKKHFGKALAWKEVKENEYVQSISTAPIKEIELIAKTNQDLFSTKKAKSKYQNEK